jgi:hypothetical protein
MAREPDTATAASAREPPTDEQDGDADMAGVFTPSGSVRSSSSMRAVVFSSAFGGRRGVLADAFLPLLSLSHP